MGPKGARGWPSTGSMAAARKTQNVGGVRLLPGLQAWCPWGWRVSTSGTAGRLHGHRRPHLWAAVGDTQLLGGGQRPAKTSVGLSGPQAWAGASPWSRGVLRAGVGGLREQPLSLVFPRRFQPLLRTEVMGHPGVRKLQLRGEGRPVLPGRAAAGRGAWRPCSRGPRNPTRPSRRQTLLPFRGRTCPGSHLHSAHTPLPGPPGPCPGHRRVGAVRGAGPARAALTSGLRRSAQEDRVRPGPQSGLWTHGRDADGGATAAARGDSGRPALRGKETAPRLGADPASRSNCAGAAHGPPRTPQPLCACASRDVTAARGRAVNLWPPGGGPPPSPRALAAGGACVCLCLHPPRSAGCASGGEVRDKMVPPVEVSPLIKIT
ncbi:ATP synthase subunit e, mitochondrial isoform X2 [Symphalangus syndactylus]|uniref:ATP synthase subunit e, mitochondrial isoform X2 n=1 Tax=Symphalangus syndactylus TaxID=9590 RepID=UPI00300766C2